MKFTLTVLPKAEQDISEAYRWYAERGSALGREFLRAMDVCLASIEENPCRFPAIENPIRRALLRRFPYAVYYFTRGRRIAVLACFHGRRDPQRLRDRTQHV